MHLFLCAVRFSLSVGQKGDCSKPMSDVPSTCEHDGISQWLVGTEFPANMMVRVQGRLREHAEFWLYELEPILPLFQILLLKVIVCHL